MLSVWEIALLSVAVVVYSAAAGTLCWALYLFLKDGK